ncbi:MAG TPA: PH domain-containing protein, partial [Sphingobacterium sp.]|nr:PH domain-containing protein [Sphingobacterium sp.]
MSIDKFLQDGQDPKIVEKIHNKILDMLTHGEAINYIALQKKPAVTLLPDSIAISNRRIFLCEFTKLGLATNFEIFSWRDIKDIAFKEEIFGSKVTVIPFTGENLSIDYIPKVQARKLYQLIKEALESSQNTDDVQEVPLVVETRTEVKASSINELYKQQAAQKKEAEQRATSGGFIPEVEETPETEVSKPVAPVSQQAPVVAPKEEEDELTLKLKKLKNLYDKQLITQAEYESKKAEILS